MGVEEFERAISGHRLLALDTMVFSYHLSGHPRYVPLTRVVLEAIESGQVAGLTTTITLAEVLTVPAQVGDRRAMVDYETWAWWPSEARTLAWRVGASLRTMEL